MDTLSCTFYPFCFCCSRAAVGERLLGRRTSRQNLPSTQVRRASQGCQGDPGIAPNGVSRAQLLVFEDLACSLACSFACLLQLFADSSPLVVPSGSLFVVAWLVLVAAVAAGCWHSGLVVVLVWVAVAVAADWAAAVSAVEVVELVWIGTAAAEYLVLENATVAFAAQPVSGVEPELVSRRLVEHDVPSFAVAAAAAELGYCGVAAAAAAAVVVVAAAAAAAAAAVVVAAVAAAAAAVAVVVVAAAAAAVAAAAAAVAAAAVAAAAAVVVVVVAAAADGASSDTAAA
jgi:hypothetical protein